METILSDINKFEKVSIQLAMKKISTIIWRDLKNQEVCLPNNVKRLKQSEVDQEFYMDFVKYIKALLMFVPPFRSILSATGTPSYKLARLAKV